jgi:type IV secretion system protein VirB1
MIDALTLSLLLAACAPQVHPATARALLTVESSLNPYAIGVVGGRLERQPRTEGEALATIAALDAGGWTYSVGLGQINVGNFGRLGLSARSALDPCTSLAAMQAVLGECYARAAFGHPAQTALRFALSCYYSGNFSTGYRHGYVRKVVLASAAASALPNRKDHP